MLDFAAQKFDESGKATVVQGKLVKLLLKALFGWKGKVTEMDTIVLKKRDKRLTDYT